MKRHRRQLWQLLGLLYDLQQQEAVRVPMRKELEARLGNHALSELLLLLIRQLTLLHRANRQQEKGAYQSEQIDVLAAVKLLHRELKTETLLSWELRCVYTRLLEHYGTNKAFRRRDIEQYLRVSRSQSWELISKLEQCGKAQRVGGTRYTGYYYELSNQC